MILCCIPLGTQLVLGRKFCEVLLNPCANLQNPCFAVLLVKYRRSCLSEAMSKYQCLKRTDSNKANSSLVFDAAVVTVVKFKALTESMAYGSSEKHSNNPPILLSQTAPLRNEDSPSIQPPSTLAPAFTRHVCMHTKPYRCQVPDHPRGHEYEDGIGM